MSTKVTVSELIAVLLLLQEEKIFPLRIDFNRHKCRQAPLLLLPSLEEMISAARIIAGDDTAIGVRDEHPAPFVAVRAAGFDLTYAQEAQ